MLTRLEVHGIKNLLDLSIDFGPFGADEANAWLALRGSDRTVRGPSTLAELYAIAEDRELDDGGEDRRCGFARALTR